MQKALIWLFHDTDKAARAVSLQFFFINLFWVIVSLELRNWKNLYKMFITFLIFGKTKYTCFFFFLNFVIGPIDMSRRLNGAGSTHNARFNWYKLMFSIWVWSWVLWMDCRFVFFSLLLPLLPLLSLSYFSLSLYLSSFYFPNLQWHYLHCIFRIYKPSHWHTNDLNAALSIKCKRSRSEICHMTEVTHYSKKKLN